MNPSKPNIPSVSLTKEEMVKQLNQKITDLNQLYARFKQEHQRYQDPSSQEMLSQIKVKLAKLSALRQKLLDVSTAKNEDAEVGQIEKVGPEGVTIASKDPANKIKQIVPQTSLAKDPTTGKLILNKAAGTTAAGSTEQPQGPKPGEEVAMVSDSVGDTSPISGNEDHDEISKLLVSKLRHLAGIK